MTNRAQCSCALFVFFIDQEIVLIQACGDSIPTPRVTFARAKSNQKHARGRGISISLSPSNPLSLKRLFKGAKGPLARGATPPADLRAGCTTRSGVMVQIRHCDNHTVVCSRPAQFDSRPKGEWFFVEVGIFPIASLGEWGATPPRNPAPRRRGTMSLVCSQALKSARGVAPLARGRSPLEDVVAGPQR